MPYLFKPYYFCNFVDSTKSKIYFVVLTALLVGGFPNFMAQEAHAHAVAGVPTVATIQTTSSTTILITFNEHVDSVTANVGGQFTLSTGGTISSNDITGGSDTITLTTDTAFATDALPTVTYVAGDVLDLDENNALAGFGPTAATDLAPATFVSAATTSATTIDITFSEDIVDTSVELADIVIGGVAGGNDISAKSVTGAVLTITTNGYDILSSDNPTITVTLTANELEDTGTLNDTVTFGPSAVTNNEALSASGSGCENCEAPTLGVNSQSKRIVENGFTYNGKPTDAERFFTPYPLITATVGKQNTAVFKIYEDKGPENIKHFSFAFGLSKGQIISESKAMIELDIDHEGTETVTVTDPENASDNIVVSTNITNCNGDDSDTKCLMVTIDHRFRAPLDFNIVGTDVWDMKRNAWQNYFNHGIEITGESLNPANEYDGVSTGHIYHLTETGKTTAIDEFGDTWSFQYGKWMKDYVQNERIQDTTSVFNRNHSDFVDYKEQQAQNAIPQLLQYCPSCLTSHEDFKDSFGYEYPETIDKLDNPEILQKMILENEKAQVIMDYLLDPVSYRR